MAAISIVGLYIWSFLASAETLKTLPEISLLTVIPASLVIILSFIFYLWAPDKAIVPSAVIIYYLLLITVGLSIFESGGINSQLLILWPLLAVFANVFGILGILPILIAPAAMGTFYYVNSTLAIDEIIVIAAGGILPLIASLLMWNRKAENDQSGDKRAYRTLATELSEVANKSEVVINAIGDGVVAIDAQSVIQLINPAAQRLIGWGKQDALALNYKSVLKLINQTGAVLDDVGDPIQQALNTNQQIRTNNLTLLTHSGKKLMISLVASPVGDAGSGVIVVFRDITKEKAEEREQAEFISTASHEMRTPVASIEGYLGLALNPSTAQIDEKARNFIIKAQEASQHLGRLFQDLLDISKVEDKRLSNNPNVIDLTVFTHDIVEGFRPKAVSKKLRLTYKPIPNDNAGERRIAPVYFVNLDNDHMREVLDNLIDNAIKYTPNGEVVVDVNGDDEHVTISIKDTGIGIPAEDISHLFQKFYRVENKDTRDIGGTGLGLFLCRRLVETMSGRIWVESFYGKGSTFFVEFPRISNQDAEELQRQQALKAQQEQEQAQASQPTPVMPSSSAADGKIPEAPRSVPRGEALTPEQIRAYAARQQAIAERETAAKQQPAISVPERQPEQPK